MVELGLDRDLAGILTPSGVVRRVMVEAAQKLSTYLRDRPKPFASWLRQLTREHLARVRRWYRGHHGARRDPLPWVKPSDELALALGLNLRAGVLGVPPHGSGLGVRVRAALARLSEEERDLLLLRHAERLPVSQIATLLGLTEPEIQIRMLRVLERLADLLRGDNDTVR
jgi:RNA polymerase sigma-70 factor (ECF subfamily)